MFVVLEKLRNLLNFWPSLAASTRQLVRDAVAWAMQAWVHN